MYVSASVHICVFKYMCVCVYVYTWVCGGQRRILGTFLKSPLLFFWRQDLAVSASLLLALQENYSTLDFYMRASNLN